VAVLDPARYVGHMEQHPGAQEAAGLPAGEAAAAEERPSSTVLRYVQGHRARTQQGDKERLLLLLSINGVFIT